MNVATLRRESVHGRRQRRRDEQHEPEVTVGDEWHEFFKQAYNKNATIRVVYHYKEAFKETVNALVEGGLEERDAVLYVLDMSEQNNAPMRLLEVWAEDLWPQLFADDEDDE